MKKIKFWIIPLAIILVDQLTKYFARQSGNYIKNTGAAWGTLQGANIFLAILTIAVIIFILIKWKELEGIPISLILGGAVGNLIDRIIFGHVIDFIDFKYWPLFNIADSAITIGVIMLLWKGLKKK